MKKNLQFKLLNFHKFLGNFASSLVGVFIPMIIYKSTNSLRLAVLFLLGQCLFRIVFSKTLAKFYIKYPQLSLMLKAIPMLAYNIILLFIDQMQVWGIILIAILGGLNLSIKNNVNGILLNYNSQKASEKKLTITRIVDAGSAIVASISGGLFIDWNQTALIILSTSLYLISVLPLFIYFLYHRNKKSFNKEFVSNATLNFENDDKLKLKTKKITKNYLFQYFIFYLIFCVIDSFTGLYSLHLFIDVPTFAKAGYISSVFQFANLLGVLSMKFWVNKVGIKKANVIAGIIEIIPIAVIPFIKSYVCIYLLFGVFGYFYSICSYFMMDSILTKCKIIGITNQALAIRQTGISVGQALGYLLVICCNKVMPVFFLMIGFLVIYSIYTGIQEERMRKQLVDYLQNNEIK